MNGDAVGPARAAEGSSSARPSSIPLEARGGVPFVVATPSTAPGSAAPPPPLAGDRAQEVLRLKKEKRAAYDRDRHARLSREMHERTVKARKRNALDAFAAGVDAEIVADKRQALEDMKSKKKIRMREKRSTQSAAAAQEERQADILRLRSVRDREDEAQRAARLAAEAERQERLRRQ